jgi:Macrocin-O-methyltransferase (TylF)
MNRLLEYCNHILLFLKKNILKRFVLFVFERFQKISPKKLYLQYHPDSYSLIKKYPEFNLLFERFIQQNKKNNLGDINRLWSFIININQILEEKIEGDFAEVGVWRGNTAAVLAYYAVIGKRKVFLFDTFTGFDKRDLKGLDNTKPVEFSDTSVSFVKNVIGENSEVCEFIEGYFPESLNNSHQRRYSIVSLDCDLYEPTKAGLDFFILYFHVAVFCYCMIIPVAIGMAAKKRLMNFVSYIKNLLFYCRINQEVLLSENHSNQTNLFFAHEYSCTA